MEDFNELAREWDNEPRRIERAKAVADEIINKVPYLSAKSGFEYGCGTGLLSFNLQPYLKKISLGDNSEGMLAVVEKKITKSNISNMHIIKIDLTTDELPNEKYDLIYTLMTLHHIIDTDEVLKTFYKLLNPSGYICIADLEEEDGLYHSMSKDFIGHNGFNRLDLSNKLKNNGYFNINSEICYEEVKKIENGEKKFLIFFMMAQKGL
jgi:ubiquinone/menaquinone biosynthesis C-methylase UbiE